MKKLLAIMLLCVPICFAQVVLNPIKNRIAEKNYTPKPIPTGQEVLSDKTFSEKHDAWYKQNIISMYTTFGETDKEWADQAEAFMTDLAEYFVSWQPNQEPKLLRQVEDLTAQGCIDPFILFQKGTLLVWLERWRESVQMLRSAYERIQMTDYPSIAKYYVANRYDFVAKLSKMRGGEIEAIRDRKAYYLAKAATEDMYTKGRQRYYFKEFLSAWSNADFWERPKKKYLEYINSFDDADPWIKNMVNGYYYFRTGWSILWKDGVFGVEEENRAGYKHNLSIAGGYFKKAYELHPEYPEGAAHMIHVAIAIEGEISTREWFDRSVAAQFDYDAAYGHYKWAIHPRMGGSVEDYLTFARECGDVKRYDSKVPTLYFYFTRDMCGWQHYDFDEYRKEGVWEKHYEIYKNIIQNDYWKDDVNFWHTVIPQIAWAAGKYKIAHELYEKLGDKAQDEKAGKFLNSEGVFIRGEIAARNGNMGELIGKAEELFQNNLDLKALPLFRKVLENNPDNKAAHQYLKNRIFQLENKQAETKGSWISIQPEADLKHWEVCEGKWHVEKDGTLIGVSDTQGLRILSDYTADDDFEIKGQIGDYSEDGAEFDSALVVGVPGKSKQYFTAVRVYASENWASMGRGFWNQNHAKIPIESSKTYDIHLQVWNSTLSLWVNGKLVQKELPIRFDAWASDNPRIGFMGGYWRSSPPGKILKFRNFKLRMNNVKPPIPSEQNGESQEIDNSKTSLKARGEMNPAEKKNFLNQRTAGNMFGRFGDYASVLYALADVTVLAEGEDILNAELRTYYPEWYNPTWNELFTMIGRQTGSTFKYNAEKGTCLFTAGVMPLPYSLRMAQGWRKENRGEYTSYIPQIAPVGMDIYMLGEYSANDVPTQKKIHSKAIEAAAMMFARHFNESITVQQMEKVKIGSYETLHYKTVAPQSGAAWRQWIFFADNMLYAIVSSIDPKNEAKLYPNVQSMINSFKTKSSPVTSGPPKSKGKAINFNLGPDDIFSVEETEEWKVELVKEASPRLVVVKVEPKTGNEFSLQLNFLHDVGDQARFNTEDKMKKIVLALCKKIEKGSVEGKTDIRMILSGDGYGWYAFFTDKEMSGKTKMEPGEYKYLTKGMIRVTDNCAMAFTFLSNSQNGTPEYGKVFRYIRSFVKKK